VNLIEAACTALGLLGVTVKASLAPVKTFGAQPVVVMAVQVSDADAAPSVMNVETPRFPKLNTDVGVLIAEQVIV
jgi:hypothetical protein